MMWILLSVIVIETGYTLFLRHEYAVVSDLWLDAVNSLARLRTIDPDSVVNSDLSVRQSAPDFEKVF